MAEIKEQRSAFAALDKDVVQEWLAHPGTIEFTRQIDGKIADAEAQIAEYANHSWQIDDSDVARFVKSSGAVMRELAKVRFLLEEAQRYANSI